MLLSSAASCLADHEMLLLQKPMTEDDELALALAMSVEDVSQPQASTSADSAGEEEAPAPMATGSAPSSPSKARGNGVSERENAPGAANGAAAQVCLIDQCHCLLGLLLWCDV